MDISFKITRVVLDYPKQKRVKITLFHETLCYSRTFDRPIKTKRFLEKQGFHISKEDEEVIKKLFRLARDEKGCRQRKRAEKATTLVDPQESETMEALQNMDWETLIPQHPIIVNCQKRGLKSDQLKTKEALYRKDEEAILIPENMLKVEILEIV